MADNKIRLYTQATVDLEFQDLPGDGTLNDKIFKYLVTIGGEGTLTDMLKAYHDGDLGAGPTVSVITINSVGPQEASGDVPVDYTIDINDSTVEAVLFLATEADPVAADFGGTGEPTYIDLGPINLTVGGAAIDDLTIPDGLDDNYKLALLPTNGGDSDVVVSSSFALDTTAPAYASSTPADEGTDIAIDTTIAITFDEAIAAGTGTFVLYDVTGAAVVETFTVGGTGDNGGTISISTPTVTLTPGANLSNSNAYSVRWTAGAITDAKSNPVAANSGDTLLNFTTVAAGSTFDVSFVGYQQHPNTTDNQAASAATISSVPIGVADSARKILFFVHSNQNSGTRHTSITVGGVSASFVAEELTNGSNQVQLWEADVPTGTTADFVITPASVWNRLGVSVFRGINCQIDGTASGNNASSSSVSANINTSTGGALIVGVQTQDSSGTHTASGYTETDADDLRTTDWARSGLATGLTAETPRSVSLSFSSAAFAKMISAAISEAP